LFITDGGLETSLIFLQGVELPEFASFTLMADDAGRSRLWGWYESFAELARGRGVGLIFDTPTWRASADWGERLGYDADALAQINRAAVGLLAEVRGRYESEATPIVVGGCLGPRGDGYQAIEQMSPDEARAYHRPQIESLAEGGADLITVFTLTYADEAIGITRAALEVGIPVGIGFTVETDGRLPDGSTLEAAVTATDEATDEGPAYYFVNCAHPTHFGDVFEPGAAWTDRVRGVRVNASMCSHAELDEAETLDDGDPVDLGQRVADLHQRLPRLSFVGGCCGTDHRHIDEIARACASRMPIEA
jgi:S-methylmethionine-dependent homocysteine/selenocysteine methylase